MHHSGPLPLTFEGPEQGFGVKTAKMRVREKPIIMFCTVSRCNQISVFDNNDCNIQLHRLICMILKCSTLQI